MTTTNSPEAQPQGGEPPSRIWLDAVDCRVDRASGVYYMGKPSIASIEYVRADLPRATAGDSILRPLCAEHPHVRFVEGVLGGVQPLIEGHRIGVSHLLGRMAIGMSLAEYQETWGFNDDVIKDVFAYAQDVVDALIDRECATSRATGETTVEAALVRELAELPLLVSGSQPVIFQRIRALQERARSGVK